VDPAGTNSGAGLGSRPFSAPSSLAWAAEPLVEIVVGDKTRTFSREELLGRPDAATIEVTKDITSGGPISYRAVPAASLLSGLTFPPGSVIEAVATDRFAAQIPLDLLLNTDASESIAWIAVEPAERPWPKVAGKDYSAGPWGRRSMSQCLPCHKLNGAGASDVGPDLNLPMNATEYMTEKGLHALIRDPKSVRAWPGMKMNGWPPELISDREIGLIIAYLKHMAGARSLIHSESSFRRKSESSPRDA
jgi:hypothetical protein